MEWVRDALHASHADERREHAEAIKRHQAEYKRLDERIHAMYLDKLDGLVDTAFFERISNQWREEQNCCQREIERHQNADKSYLSEGVALLDLARNAQRLFAEQEPREKRRLLNFVLSNCTWEDGEVVATFRQPFDMLAETVISARNETAAQTRSSRVFENWLAGVGEDANYEFSISLLPTTPELPKMRKRDRDRSEALRLAGGPKPSLRDRAVALATERGVVRTRDLADIGVPRCYLARMCEEGLLVKVGYGLYRAADRDAA